MTEKQKLQKDRAYFKFVLSGMPKPINLESLTSDEREHWSLINAIRTKLIDNFNKNSIELGLNVPEHKCWCGKKAKYQSDYGDGLVWVCSKHNK